MERFVRNGTKFTAFEKNGETYLCTGDVDGTVKFVFAGEICDFCTVTGATSVVSGTGTIDELYQEWLDKTEFYRSIGVKF